MIGKLQYLSNTQITVKLFFKKYSPNIENKHSLQILINKSMPDSNSPKDRVSKDYKSNCQ
jgi:hypothetical protein